MTFSQYKKGERAGLAIMGLDCATLTIDNAEIGLTLNQIECINADNFGKDKFIHFVFTKHHFYSCKSIQKQSDEQRQNHRSKCELFF